jgi:hypothetical protein
VCGYECSNPRSHSRATLVRERSSHALNDAFGSFNAPNASIVLLIPLLLSPAGRLREVPTDRRPRSRAGLTPRAQVASKARARSAASTSNLKSGSLSRSPNISKSWCMR